MNRKKTKTFLLYSLKLLFTFFIFSLILYGFQAKLGNQKNILNQIKFHFQNIHYSWFIFAVALYIIASFMTCCRIFLLAKSHKIEIPYFNLLKNIYIGYLFNPLLMGTTGGDIIRSYYLAKQTGKKTEIVTIVFLDRLVGICVLSTLSIFVLLINYNDPKLQPILHGALIFYTLLILGAVLSSSRKFIDKFSFLKKIFKQSKIQNIARRSFETLHATRKFKKTLIKAALWTLLFQSTFIFLAWIVSKSLTTIPPVPLKYFFLFLPIIFTISAIPISLGGIGVGEAAYAALFAIVGVAEADAITLSLLNRFILIIGALIGGIVYLMPSTMKIDIETALKEENNSL